MNHGSLDPVSLREIVFDTLDASDDLVLVLEQIDQSVSGIVVATANDAFCRVSGHSHSDLAGRPLLSLAAPEAEPGSFAAAVRAAHGRKSLRTELLCKRPNGSSFWLGLHLMPARESIPQRFVILGRDITESLQARKQQAAIQGLLAKVFLCVQVAVAIVTEDGLIQMTNPALDHLLGHPPGALIGKRAIDCIAAGARQRTIAARQKQVENDLDYTIGTSLVRADGTEIALDLTSVTVQRTDLRRFRIITLVNAAGNPPPPVTVHVAGKIRLVGLQEVKSAFGPRWDDVATRAKATAEHVIRRHCGPRDTYSPTESGEFLICFGDGTEDEAAFRAATIAREIRRRLIGEGATGPAAHVTAMTAAVEVPNEPGRPADMLGSMINERLNSRLATIEAQAKKTLQEAAVSATCELEPVWGRRASQPVAHYAQLPQGIERRIQTAYCTLTATERQSFDFDRLVLGVAAEQIVANLAAGISTPILVSVNFDVFLDRHFTERYLGACQTLDPRLRERLMLVLADLPPGCPQGRLLECITNLRPFCRSVGIEMKTLEVPTVDLANFGSPVVALRIDGLSVDNVSDMAKLSKLIDYLHNHRSRVLIRGTQNQDDAMTLAREFGADLVSVQLASGS